MSNVRGEIEIDTLVYVRMFSGRRRRFFSRFSFAQKHKNRLTQAGRIVRTENTENSSL